MRYAEALGLLYGLAPRGMRLELSRMRRVLALRGHPERALPVVHVAGTNGKGSVAAMIASALRAAGYRTGLYTSPHLHRFVERIRVDGRPISERDVAARVAELTRFLSRPGRPPLTFFEHATVLALEHFRDARCDVAVLEVGLGGRFDATNVVWPEVAVVTGIARDHERWLGRTLADIAREKAGVLKRGVPAVLGVRGASARAVFREVVVARRVAARWIDDDFEALAAARGPAGAVDVRLGDRWLRGLHLGLEGAHQRDNAALAVAAIDVLRGRRVEVGDAALRRGLAEVRWPGRLEWLDGRPPVLLDAAHNPDGCRSLARHLEGLGTSRRRVLVFGAMADKDHRAMLTVLRPRVDACVFVAPRTSRAARPEALARICPGVTAPSVEAGLRLARQGAGRGGLVVVAGSIFVLGEARAELLGVRTEPPLPF